MTYRHTAGSALLMVAAPLLYTAFHFLPAFGEEPGRWVWGEISRILFNGKPQWGNPVLAWSVSSFLGVSVAIVAAPLLVGVFRVSRLTWWLVTVVSGLSAGLLWFVTVAVMAWPGTGGCCLLLAALLNFAGLRRVKPDDLPSGSLSA